jgi:hypothetical protein
MTDPDAAIDQAARGVIQSILRIQYEQDRQHILGLRYRRGNVGHKLAELRQNYRKLGLDVERLPVPLEVGKLTGEQANQ